MTQLRFNSNMYALLPIPVLFFLVTRTPAFHFWGCFSRAIIRNSMPSCGQRTILDFWAKNHTMYQMLSDVSYVSAKSKGCHHHFHASIREFPCKYASSSLSVVITAGISKSSARLSKQAPFSPQPSRRSPQPSTTQQHSKIGKTPRYQHDTRYPKSQRRYGELGPPHALPVLPTKERRLPSGLPLLLPLFTFVPDPPCQHRGVPYSQRRRPVS